MIFEALVNKKATEVKRDADLFCNEHPIATCLLIGMGAVIFAQRVELNCYRIINSR